MRWLEMGTVQPVSPELPQKVEAQIVEMKVPLYSYGCEKKVKKALSHIRGIHSVHVNYELQKVTVWGICDRDIILETMKKKRRESKFWNSGNPEEEGAKDPMEEEIGSNEMDDGDGDELQQAEVANNSKRSGFKGRKLWKKLLPFVREVMNKRG